MKKTLRFRALSTTLLVAALASGAACFGDSSSDITVAYRGDIASYRELVRVRVDAAQKGRVVVPAFPSAAKPEPIPTKGAMQVVVTMKRADGRLLARDSLPTIELAPRSSYGVNVIVSARRPGETRCTDTWHATPIAAPAVESLYVSITTAPRGNPPSCDD